MTEYYKEMMKDHKPAPDMICRFCGHAVEDHIWTGKGDSEQGGREECTNLGCTCKKFRNRIGIHKKLCDDDADCDYPHLCCIDCNKCPEGLFRCNVKLYEDCPYQESGETAK